MPSSSSLAAPVPAPDAAPSPPPLASAAVAELSEALLLAPAHLRARLLRERPPANPALLVRDLCERSLALAGDSPDEALDAARAALDAARSSRGSEVPRAARADLRAEAWAYVANAWRVAEAYPRAERGFRQAERLRKLGSNDPVFAAGLAEMEAQLKRGQRRLKEAACLLGRAVRTYRRAGCRDLFGRALFSSAHVAFCQGETEKAHQLVLKGLRALDPKRQPELFFHAAHASVRYLSVLGHHALAVRLLPALATVYPLLGGELVALRGEWLAGQVLAGCEHWFGAQNCFERVCRGFAAHGLDYDAALAGFDLAWAYAQQGRWMPITNLALEMNEVFCSKKIPREACAAFDLFFLAASNARIGWSEMKQVHAELEPLRRERGG